MTIPLPAGGIAGIKTPWSGHRIGAYAVAPDLWQDEARMRPALQAWVDGLRSMNPASREAWMLFEAPDADEASARRALRLIAEATTETEAWGTAFRFAEPVVAALQETDLPARFAVVASYSKFLDLLGDRTDNLDPTPVEPVRHYTRDEILAVIADGAVELDEEFFRELEFGPAPHAA